MDIYQEGLYQTINEVTDDKVKKLKFDYTIEGKITAYDDVNSIYTVLYDGVEIQVKARSGLTLSIGDIVYIRVIRNDFKNKFIDCKKP